MIGAEIRQQPDGVSTESLEIFKGGPHSARTVMKLIRRLGQLIPFAVCFLATLILPGTVLAGNKTCAAPPLVESLTAVQPNVLIVMGNSITMGKFAYDATFDENINYYGYFNSDKIYTYSNSKHYFQEVKPDPRDAATIKQRAVCLKRGSGSCPQAFSGNWLNWASMRRMDVAKKVLTGGRLGGEAREYVLVGDMLYFFNHNQSTHWSKNFDDRRASKYNGYYTPFQDSVTLQFGTFDRTCRETGGSCKSANVPYVPTFKVEVSGKGIVSGNATYGNMGEIQYVGGEPGDPTRDALYTCADPTQNSCGSAGTCQSDNWQNKNNCGEYPCTNKTILDKWVKDLAFRCGSYYVAVKVGDVGTDSAPQGVIQNVIQRVRIGYMDYNLGQGPNEHANGMDQGDYYNDLSFDWTVDGRIDYVSRIADGGQVLLPLSDRSTVSSFQKDSTGTSLPILKLVKTINDDHPRAQKPMSETFKEALLYFQQQDPAYCSDCCPDDLSHKEDTVHGWCLSKQVPNFQVNSVWDPYYYSDYGKHMSCAKSYIILLADGDPDISEDADKQCDENVTLRRADGQCAVYVADSSHALDGYPQDYTSGLSPLLDNVAFYMHTQDLRDLIAERQTIDVFTVNCFAKGTAAEAPLLKATAKAGGFVYDLTDTAKWPAEPRYQYQWDANGDGVPDNYYAAKDGWQLENQILTVFGRIFAQGSGGAVATVSQEIRAGDIVIRGAFDHTVNEGWSKAVWAGHLEVYWPDADTAKYDFENFPGIFCTDMDPLIAFGKTKNCWDGGDFLVNLGGAGSPARDRVMFTYLDRYDDTGPQRAWRKEKMEFKYDKNNTNENGVTVTTAEILQPYLNSTVNPVDTLQKAQALMQWVRGAVDTSGNPLDSAGNKIFSDPAVTYRNRKRNIDTAPETGSQWLLGDIIYSTPVIVGSPSLATIVPGEPDQDSFMQFREQYFYRNKMVYVGGNDGMVHAFLLATWDNTNQKWAYTAKDGCSDCGKEMWAYVPSNLLPDLSRLARTDYGTNACQHFCMVDLAPQAFDVFIKYKDSSGSTRQGWRTVLIGGERGGGDVYFAIDVTDPPTSQTYSANNPNILWEYSVLKNLAVAYSESATTDKIARPYADPALYALLRDLPMSWSEPTVGRLTVPPSVNFTYWANDYTQTTDKTQNSPAVISVTKGYAADQKHRHVAFMGGGFRVFKEPWSATGPPNPDNAETRKAIFKPNLLAIDIETGANLWQKVWPLVVKYAPSTMWPDLTSGPPAAANIIPYAINHPIGVDVWDEGSDAKGEDGFIDRLYFGDLGGLVYSLKLKVSDPTSGSGSMTISMQKQHTKEIDASASQNYYRYLFQPITGKFAAAWTRSKSNLAIFLGTGKLDDVYGGTNDDLNDTGQMTLFTTLDPVAAWTPGTDELPLSVNSTTNVITGGPNTSNSSVLVFSGQNFKAEILEKNCPTTAGTGFDPDQLITRCANDSSGNRDLTTCCNWSKGTYGDCCESGAPSTCTSGSPCWNCVWDLSTPGERVIDRPLVAGGLVFFSTGVPSQNDPCRHRHDSGYIYIFDFECKPFPANFLAVTSSGTLVVIPLKNDADQTIGQRITFPEGIPSRPILDSSGEHVLIQGSTSELVQIPVNLLEKPVRVIGWREK